MSLVLEPCRHQHITAVKNTITLSYKIVATLVKFLTKYVKLVENRVFITLPLCGLKPENIEKFNKNCKQVPL